MKQRESVINWAGTVTSTPALRVTPRSEADVIEILTHPDQYPSPVRAMGHYHSTTACVATDGGTIMQMTALDKIIELGDHTVTVQAGAQYQQIARELAARGKNFFINLQIGPVTLGSLACCDSKDGSAPQQFGQFGAYAIAFRVAQADGHIVTIDQRVPELLAAMRSSYGMLGIVLEVTFRITELRPVKVEHITFSTTRFIEQLPQLRRRNASMMLYLFPFSDRVTVMLRTPADPQKSRNRWVWWLRNNGVAWIIAPLARLISWLPFKRLRFLCQQLMLSLSRWTLERFICAASTNPVDQATRYAKRPVLSRFTFSIFAFPEKIYPQVLLAYQQFCLDYYREHHYRPDLLNVGYRVAQSDHALFSYSSDSDVMTIDPVATGGPEWDKFVAAFNEFCLRYGGRPLFNQSPKLQHRQVQQVYARQLQEFVEIRDRLDPKRRLLNRHFENLLYGH